jgi:hypothetical protein
MFHCSQFLRILGSTTVPDYLSYDCFSGCAMLRRDLNALTTQPPKKSIGESSFGDCKSRRDVERFCNTVCPINTI